MNKFVLIAFIFMGLVACSTTTSPIDDDSEESALSSSSTIKSSESKNVSNSSSSSLKDTAYSSFDNALETSSSSEVAETCTGETNKVWNGTTAKTFACGRGTKLSPYIILTAEELAHLSFVIGAKDSDYSADTYFKLGADIILHDEKLIDDNGALVADSTKLIKWTPIGNSSVSFAAHFDGDGHKVSGIFINTSSTYNGLFGNVKGTVENVTVTNSWINGGNYTGGIAGYSMGDIKNATNEGSVNSTEECLGGIVGKVYQHSYNVNATLTNVQNSGVIVGNKSVGGIAGCAYMVTLEEAFNTGFVSGKGYVGGIFGGISNSSNNKIKYVRNTGNVTGTHFLGGIAGYCGGSAYFYSSGKSGGSCSTSYSCGSIDYAINTGEISGKDYAAGIFGSACTVNATNLGNLGIIEGDNYAGGIFGFNGYSTTASMYNKGLVYGASFVGGIFGYNKEGVTQAAYTVAAVDGDEFVGVMIGKNYNATLADYYYLAQGSKPPFGENDGGGFATEKTSDEMQSADFLTLLGDDFIIQENVNDGYPLLKWGNRKPLNYICC